jgi:hypothetical protein
MAQTEIHRCIGANGGAVFTDQPCAALQATPVNNPVAIPRNDLPPSGPPPIMCAASLGELRQSVIDAFASRDANRLAGLMLWDGYGRGAAIANIRSLGELMKQPLLDLTPSTPAVAASSADPFAAPEAPPDPPPASNQLVLHTGGNDGSESSHELRFSVVSRAGCLWLRPAD